MMNVHLRGDQPDHKPAVLRPDQRRVVVYATFADLRHQAIYLRVLRHVTSPGRWKARILLTPAVLTALLAGILLGVNTPHAKADGLSVAEARYVDLYGP